MTIDDTQKIELTAEEFRRLEMQVATVGDWLRDYQDARLTIGWLISALRGPDYGGEYSEDASLDMRDALKFFTTARIRAMLHWSYGDVNYSRLDGQEIKMRDDMLAKAPTHFQSHYFYAVQVIRALKGYDLITETNIGEKPKDGNTR